MDFFEESFLSKSVNMPKLWLRYVDDTFVIWQHGKEKLGEFLENLNSEVGSIKFTMEVEVNKTIPFLDVLAMRESSSIMTTVYRKPTHT